MISWFIPTLYMLYCFSFLPGNVAQCRSCSFSDCEDYWLAGHRQTGEYHVVPMGMVDGFNNIFCDMDGGWIIMQKRVDGQQDFNKTWRMYEKGFGDINHGYWIGLWRLWSIVQQGHYQLRIDLTYWNGTNKYAIYNSFTIGGPREKYVLHAYVFSGDAEDSLKNQNGLQFSTKDNDNDSNPEKNCATDRGGGWWHKSCGPSNLNGRYAEEDEYPGEGGIRWKELEDPSYSFKETKMMIRRN